MLRLPFPVLVAAAALTLGACSFDRKQLDFTPLVEATRAGDTTRMLELLRAGADPNAAAGINAWPPLMHAVHKGQVKAMRVLLEHGADANGHSPDGFNALIMAAGYGDAEAVRLLLDHGADPRAVTRGGESALQAAVGGTSDIDNFTVGKCQTETVRTLLDKAPDLRLKSAGGDRRALLLARLTGCRDVVRMVDR